MDFNWKTEYYRYHHYFFNLQKIMQNTQARSLAWFSLSIFTVCFFALVAIRPTLVTIAKLDKEIKDQQEAVTLLQNKINAIIAAQQEFSANIDNLPLLDEALPERNEFPKLAFFVEQMVAENGVTLQSLNFEKVGDSKPAAKAVSGPNKLTFSLGVTGSYPQLKEFLTAVESSRRIIKMERASFSQVKKENSLEVLLSISGEAYFYGNQSL